ncbi:MAG: DUF421 domain-containing protein [Ruminococcus sp.]
MDLFKVFLSTIASIVVLFLLSKLIGNKQISQLNLFDYINGITIGSIAAEMATSLETDVFKPLLAMIIFGVVGWVLSLVSRKNFKARRYISGKAILLYDKNKLYKEDFKKAKINIDEFLAQLRIQGYFSLEDIETAILESSGRISVLPKAEKRPCTPSDLALSVPTDRPEVNVIIDGDILLKNLKYTGNNENWLDKKLKDAKIKVNDVFLATVNSDNQITFYKKDFEKINNDIFE